MIHRRVICKLFVPTIQTKPGSTEYAFLIFKYNWPEIGHYVYAAKISVCGKEAQREQTLTSVSLHGFFILFNTTSLDSTYTTRKIAIDISANELDRKCRN